MSSIEAQKNAELLLLAAYRGGVTDPRELANFMGQMQVESQGFTKAHESLNYSAERLLAVFPGRNGMDTLEEAKAIVAGGRGARYARHGAFQGDRCARLPSHEHPRWRTVPSATCRR